MSPPQHAPTREFLTGSLLFFLGTLSPALNEWIKLAFDQQDNRSKLEDAERDYVLRVVELQSKATPGEAQAIAALTTVATRAYLRREDMRRNFANALAEYAVRISGNQAATQARADLGDASAVPRTSTGVAAAMGQVSAASLISDATNRASAPTPQAARTVLQAGSARVFFQIARDGDRAAVDRAKQRLQALPGTAVDFMPGAELVARYRGRTELRYFYKADRAEAGRLVSALAGTLPNVRCVFVPGFDGDGKATPRLFEVWLAPGAQTASAVPSRTDSPKC